MSNRVAVSVIDDTAVDEPSMCTEKAGESAGESTESPSGSAQEWLDSSYTMDEAERFVLDAMDRLSYDGEEVSVSFCSDDVIRKLNSKWRGIDASTDVLSFEDGGEYIDESGKKRRVMGDIVISYETLNRSQSEVQEEEKAELRRLLLHGLLHLHGYDHGDEHIVKGEMPQCKMLKLQEKILEEMLAATAEAAQVAQQGSRPEFCHCSRASSGKTSNTGA